MKILQLLQLLYVLVLLSSCNSQNSNESIAKKDKKMVNKTNQESDDPFNNIGDFVTAIDCQIKATKEEIKTFGDEVIPWISMDKTENEIARLIEPEKIVIEQTEITLIIDYPLNNPARFILKSPKNGFSKKYLIQLISKKYHEIYELEERSAKNKTIPLEKREGLINRNQTDGKYGIWGHDLSDLDLSSIEVYKSKEGKISILLIVES